MISLDQLAVYSLVQEHARPVVRVVARWPLCCTDISESWRTYTSLSQLLTPMKPVQDALPVRRPDGLPVAVTRSSGTTGSL